MVPGKGLSAPPSAWKKKDEEVDLAQIGQHEQPHAQVIGTGRSCCIPVPRHLDTVGLFEEPVIVPNQLLMDLEYGNREAG